MFIELADRSSQFDGKMPTRVMMRHDYSLSPRSIIEEDKLIASSRRWDDIGAWKGNAAEAVANSATVAATGSVVV